jgi:hypothetical protein
MLINKKTETQRSQRSRAAIKGKKYKAVYPIEVAPLAGKQLLF